MRPSLFVTLGIGVLISGAVATASWFRHSGFDLPACNERGELSLVDAHVPRWDYASLRSTEEEAPLSEAGTKCASAKEPEGCALAVKNAKPERSGFPNGSGGRRPGRHFFVLTRGDDVLVIDDEQKIPAALGPIDTPSKAALVAIWQNNTPIDRCEQSVRRSPKGFEVHLSTDSCFGPRDSIVEVDAEGHTTTKAQSSGRQTCVGAAPVSVRANEAG